MFLMEGQNKFENEKTKTQKHLFAKFVEKFENFEILKFFIFFKKVYIIF